MPKRCLLARSSPECCPGPLRRRTRCEGVGEGNSEPAANTSRVRMRGDQGNYGHRLRRGDGPALSGGVSGHDVAKGTKIVADPQTHRLAKSYYRAAIRRGPACPLRERCAELCRRSGPVSGLPLGPGWNFVLFGGSQSGLIDGRGGHRGLPALPL